jgi:hypothetical protein
MNNPKALPLAYTVEEFGAEAKIGRTRVYAAIKTGRLRARKYGNRTLILPDDGRAFLESLPELVTA